MSESIAPGDIIAGKFRVERLLGRGGMGVVLAARHLDLDQRVAIKVLRQDLLGGDEATTRFQREARALARLGSDHVVRVSDVGRLPDGAPYMVMEYLEGKDLSTVLKERGPMDAEVVADYLIQACAGLAEAHALGLVHRDLKPGNLFLVDRADGTTQIKVLDFGIAKSAGERRLTADRMVLGSPRYMSPEQVRSPREVDARSDIWALGAIAFRLLTDRAPFEGDSLDQQLEAMLAGRREPLGALRPDLSPGLVAVVDRCLEAARADRFANVAELGRALAEFGPPGSEERAQRIARVSVPPPAEPAGTSESQQPKPRGTSVSPQAKHADNADTSASPPADGTATTVPLCVPPPADSRATTVPLRVEPDRAALLPRLEPTVDEKSVRRASVPPPSGLPAPGTTPPRPFVPGLLAAAVLVAIAVAVATASGALGVITGIFAQTKVMSAPLPTIDRSRFDVVDVLPAATELARKLEPRSELVGIEIAGGAKNGLANAESNRVDIEFDYGAGSDEGYVVVRVMPTELLASRTPIPGARKPVPEPKCNAQSVFRSAIGAGVPRDAAPDLRYGVHEGVGTWLVEVPGRPELTREVDGQSCAIVPVMP